MLNNFPAATMWLRALLVPAAMLLAPCAAAADFFVNSFLDQPDTLVSPGTCQTTAGTCTLRAAVMQANRVTGATTATIHLPAGPYNLTIPRTDEGNEFSGDLDLLPPFVGSSPPIIIVGAGGATTFINAQQLDRVFHVHSGRTANISGVTIINGLRSSDSGGAIHNEGNLSLNGVAMYNNQGRSGGAINSSGLLTMQNSSLTFNEGRDGAAIASTGTLEITNSTISNNTASFEGGGIRSGASATIYGSTINNNTAGTDGGGIWSGGNLTLINSTISQNNATLNGGGIEVYFGDANIFNTTIFFNGADAAVTGVGRGGGIYNFNANAAVTNIRNTLIIGNYVSNSPTYRDCEGTINTYGKNLFWDTTGCVLPQPATTWGLLNSLSSLDSTLRKNGGPTRTHALLAGSNAIDGGDPVQGCIWPDSTPLPTDQRGFARVVGARCDIGAFEYILVRIDVDANNTYDALTDGLLILRYLFGLTGTSLTNGAIGALATRTTPTAVTQYLDSINLQLDVDGNSQTDALTDGLMLIRYLFGLRGAALTAGAIGPNANRTGAQIETYIQSLMP